MNEKISEKLDKLIAQYPLDDALRLKLVEEIHDLFDPKANSGVIKDGTKLIFDGIILDSGAYTLTVDGLRKKVARKEFKLLEFLMQHPGLMYERDDILNYVWGENVVVSDRTIDVHICKVRKKLGPKYEEKIFAMKGVGYKFEP